jgi:phage/plasmid-like protein (TIGR03299 family)
MSANINVDKKSGEFAFYSKKEVPWHGLGQIVQEAKISDDVIKIAHLDWNIQKLPKYIQYPLDSNYLNDKGIRLRGLLSPNDKALCRMDNGIQLGNCSDRYEIVNNVDAFRFIDNIVGEKLAIYETAGALGNGETIFVTAKLPSYIKPTSNTEDIIEKYLLFTTSHDGNGSVKIMFTPIRVVCNNTLNMALQQNVGRIVFKHTKNAQDKINRALETMKLYTDYDAQLTYQLGRMAATPITEKFIDKALANIFLTAEQLGCYKANGILMQRNFPSKTLNNLIYVKDYMEDGPGQDYSRGTAYWLYNGITTYLNNGKEYNNDTDRFESLTNGNEYKIAQKAFNTINELCLT